MGDRGKLDRKQHHRHRHRHFVAIVVAVAAIATVIVTAIATFVIVLVVTHRAQFGPSPLRPEGGRARPEQAKTSPAAAMGIAFSVRFATALD